MLAYKLPPTRKEPTDVQDNYETADYNINDSITHEDDKPIHEEYRHNGPNMYVHCQIDIDLAGQIETRQWLPWRGTVYAVPQYPAVPVFVAPSERMNVIG
jgi:hypothetical protein